MLPKLPVDLMGNDLTVLAGYEGDLHALLVCIFLILLESSQFMGAPNTLLVFFLELMDSFHFQRK